MARRPPGTKPKPAHLKLIAGNPGHRPLNPDEAKPVPSMPDPPIHMTREAKAEWARMARVLFDLGLLSDVDMAAFAAYCQAYGRWVRAELKLQKMADNDPVTEGLLVKAKNGTAIQNPLVGIANKAMLTMMNYATEFGMTPSSRTRINAEPREKSGESASRYFA